MSELVFVGYTNGHQIKYAREDEGVFYPDTDNECYIPLYMLKTHLHRIESTSDFNVTREEIFDSGQLENRIADLETDRNNAINQMSKSWKHASDKESDILTRYVTMAENQFEVKNQRIVDLERQLKAEREINDRLRVVETERAVRNDELYEVLLDISHHGVMGGNSMLRIARETLEKHKDEYGKRPLKYIAIQYSRGVYGSLFDSEQEAREEHPYADEIIPIRASGDCDE